MPKIEKFRENVVESISDVLGATDSGLTGSEIGKYLAPCGIPDGTTSTKRVRLYEALSSKQQRDDCGKSILHFIETTMDPVNHTAMPGWFESKRAELNKVLAFSGFEI